MIEFHPVVCQTFDHTNIWRKQLGSPINSLLSNPIMVKRTLKTPRGANIISVSYTHLAIPVFLRLLIGTQRCKRFPHHGGWSRNACKLQKRLGQIHQFYQSLHAFSFLKLSGPIQNQRYFDGSLIKIGAFQVDAMIPQHLPMIGMEHNKCCLLYTSCGYLRERTTGRLSRLS